MSGLPQTIVSSSKPVNRERRGTGTTLVTFSSQICMEGDPHTCSFPPSQQLLPGQTHGGGSLEPAERTQLCSRR